MTGRSSGAEFTAALTRCRLDKRIRPTGGEVRELVRRTARGATTSRVLGGRPCILRLHSIEAMQTDFPARVDWTQVHRLVLVGADIADLLIGRFPAIAGAVPTVQIANVIDLARFAPGTPDRFRIGTSLNTGRSAETTLPQWRHW